MVKAAEPPKVSKSRGRALHSFDVEAQRWGNGVYRLSVEPWKGSEDCCMNPLPN